MRKLSAVVAGTLALALWCASGAVAAEGDPSASAPAAAPAEPVVSDAAAPVDETPSPDPQAQEPADAQPETPDVEESPQPADEAEADSEPQADPEPAPEATADVPERASEPGTGPDVPAVPTVSAAAAGTAQDDSAYAADGQDVVLDLLANDVAADGETLEASTLALVDPDSGASVTSVVVPGASYGLTGPDNDLVFAPEDSAPLGATSVDYTVSDTAGTEYRATVTVTVVEGARDDAVSRDHGSSPVLHVLRNDEPSPGASFTGSTVCIRQIFGSELGPCTTSVRTDEGRWALDGQWVLFIPKPDFAGTAEVVYDVTDSAGVAMRARAKATIAEAPTGGHAVDDEGFTLTVNHVTKTVLSNDVANDGEELRWGSLALIDPETNRRVVGVNVDGKGSFSLSGHGRITFRADDVDRSGTARVRYQVVDTANVPMRAWFTVHFRPGGVDDEVTTTAGTPVSVDVTANDRPGPGETISREGVSVGGPENSDDPAADNHGTYTVNSGVVTFVPDPGFVGTTTLFYSTEDSAGQLIFADIVIHVQPAAAASAVPGALAQTGSESGPLAALGALLVLGGAGAVWLARRRTEGVSATAGPAAA